MAFTQGAALPNITTTQGQTTTAPSWYTDYLSGIANTGTTAAQNAAYVGATPLQQQAFDQTQSNVGSYQPALTGALNLANQAGGYDVATEAGRFMNPYTANVVNSLNELGLRNIRQNLAPGATSASVGSGQFGSKRGAEVLGQAINSGLQNLNATEAQALQTGYTQALQAAQNQEQARLAASQQLGNLATTTQGLGLGDINALATLGSQQQQIEQGQSLFPLQVASQQAGLLRGYTVPTSVSSTYTGPIPGAYSASPLSQIAGIGSLMGAVSNTNLGKSIGTGLSSINWGNLGTDLSNWFSGGSQPQQLGGPTDNSTPSGGLVQNTDGSYTTSSGDVINPNEYSSGV
jgi:hypothetical protein